jgi:hypothetical protein
MYSAKIMQFQFKNCDNSWTFVSELRSSPEGTNVRVRTLFISPLTGTPRRSNPDMQTPAVFRLSQKKCVPFRSEEDITKETFSGILAICLAHHNFYLDLAIQTM